MGGPQFQRVHHQSLKRVLPRNHDHVQHVRSSVRHESTPLHEPPRRVGGDGRSRHRVHQLPACQCHRSEEAAQGRDLALDGRRPQHDGPLGLEARRADRRTVQADFHQCRWRRHLRAPAADGQADAPHVDRAVDEHPRGRSHAWSLLHAHGLRSQSQRGTPWLRVRDLPRTRRAGFRSGDPALRVRRQRQRWPGLPGHDVGAVRGRFQRECSQPRHGHRSHPAGPAAENARDDRE